jgi:predicted transcriptional regulator
MEKASLGDQELELLRYIAQHGPLSVGQALEGYGKPRGLSRSTINTTIERIYKKGYLTRSLESGVFHYAALAPQKVLDNVVEQFIERTLGGSLAPFVSYFTRKSRLTAEERAELERFVEKLNRRAEEGEGTPEETEEK